MHFGSLSPLQITNVNYYYFEVVRHGSLTAIEKRELHTVQILLDQLICATSFVTFAYILVNMQSDLIICGMQTDWATLFKLS
mmetsp:Transcript_30796/g.45570  ORF Transcript_30796/g.45570 Transcript_30796/m.45570 type:complete len:82 (+) Transcript_30796:766-1011(+)